MVGVKKGQENLLFRVIRLEEKYLWVEEEDRLVDFHHYCEVLY